MSNTAFLFPGQGAQSIGMGKSLFDSLAPARALFEEADEILGYDLSTLCFEGPAERLDATDVSQPALFVSSLAALEQLKQDSPQVVKACSAAAGLSLGEYTALTFAGVLSFADGLRLVQKRGQAMQAAADATPSGMVSVLGLEIEQVEAVCDQARGDDVLQVANLLCPGNIVISGSKEACSRAVSVAEELGAMKVIPLSVAGAFHTPIMQPALDALQEAVANVPMNAPRIPVISNVDAQSHDDPEEIRELLVRQLVSPVQWTDSMVNLIERGYDQFYEIGPGRVLRGLLRRINRKVACENVTA